MQVSRSIISAAAALALAALCLPEAAHADRRHHWRHHDHGFNGGAAFFGFANGLLLGGAFGSPYYSQGYHGGPYYQPRHYQPRGYYYESPAIYAAPPGYDYGYHSPYYYRHYGN